MERPKLTVNLPVDFTINYTEDGILNIEIDTNILESRIAQYITDALKSYNNGDLIDRRVLENYRKILMLNIRL